MYNPYTNETILDDDTNFTQCDPQYEDGDYSPIVTTGCTPPCAYYTWNESFDIDDSFTEGESIRIGVNEYWNDTQNNILYMSFYQRDPSPQDWSIQVNSEYENITVKVCAEGFEKPNPSPKEGAQIMLKMREWGLGPEPTVKDLTLYDPINNTIVDYVPTGPSGCVVFNVTHPDGWPDFCNPIEGNITYNGHTEELYVANVCFGGDNP